MTIVFTKNEYYHGIWPFWLEIVVSMLTHQLIINQIILAPIFPSTSHSNENLLDVLQQARKFWRNLNSHTFALVQSSSPSGLPATCLLLLMLAFWSQLWAAVSTMATWPSSPSLHVWDLSGLSHSLPGHLIKLTTRNWSVDSPAALFTQVSKTYSSRSNDTTTRSIIDL